MAPLELPFPLMGISIMSFTLIKKNGLDKWIMKMWYLYAMEYYSAIKRNKTVPFAETRMNLETVTQSEVSQKEKNKYNILMHLCGL